MDANTRDRLFMTEKYQEMFKDYWIDFVVDLWKFVRVEINDSLLRRFYTRESLERRVDNEISGYKVLAFPLVTLFIITVPTMGWIGFFLSLAILSVLMIFHIGIRKQWLAVLRLLQNPWRLKLAFYPEIFSNDKRTKFLAWITS